MIDDWLNHPGYEASSLKDYQMWRGSYFVQNLLKSISQPINFDLKFLEAGCGSAKVGIALSLIGFKNITLLDFHPNTCKSLIEFREKNSLFYKVVCERIETINGNYDYIYNEGVLEHYEDEVERLSIYKLFYDHLNYNGLIFIIVPCSDNLTREQSKLVWKNTGAPPEIYYTSSLLKKEVSSVGFRKVDLMKFKECGGDIPMLNKKIDLVGVIGHKTILGKNT